MGVMSGPSETGELLASPVATLSARGPRVDVTRRYAWLVGGSVYYAGVQWVVLSLLARTMGAESVGRYAYALAVTGPVFMFSNMQLAQVFASDAAFAHRAAEYAGTRIVTAAASLV